MNYQKGNNEQLHKKLNISDDREQEICEAITAAGKDFTDNPGDETADAFCEAAANAAQTPEEAFFIGVQVGGALSEVANQGNPLAQLAQMMGGSDDSDSDVDSDGDDDQDASFGDGDDNQGDEAEGLEELEKELQEGDTRN